MTVDLHNYRMVCSDKAWKCRDSGHSEACYRRDPRLQTIADTYRLFIVVSDHGEAHTPEARKAFKKVLTTLDTLIDLDALTEDNDG